MPRRPALPRAAAALGLTACLGIAAGCGAVDDAPTSSGAPSASAPTEPPSTASPPPEPVAATPPAVDPPVAGPAPASPPAAEPPPPLPPAPSVPIVTLSTKRVTLAWAAVPTADHYRVLEKSEPAGTFVPAVPSTTHTSAVLERPAWAIAASSYANEACVAAGCAVSPEAAAAAQPDAGRLERAIAYFEASNATAGSEFGNTVAISADGKTLAVGAWREDGSSTGVDGDQSRQTQANAGAVYVFASTASGWVQQAYVKASRVQAGDRFGSALALDASGALLAVGVPSEDSAGSGTAVVPSGSGATNSGATYLFERDASAWRQQAYLKASNAAAGAEFGGLVSLAADGATLAVSAGKEASKATGVDGDQSDQPMPGAGAVYVFVRGGGAWIQQAYVKASNTRAGMAFWRPSLSADGNVLAVAAPAESSATTGINGDQADASSTGAGAAYVFSRRGGVWSQDAYLKAPNATAGALFGYSIALAGDGRSLLVGGAYESSASSGIGGSQTPDGSSKSGAAYLY